MDWNETAAIGLRGLRSRKMGVHGRTTDVHAYSRLLAGCQKDLRLGSRWGNLSIYDLGMWASVDYGGRASGESNEEAQPLHKIGRAHV